MSETATKITVTGNDHGDTPAIAGGRYRIVVSNENRRRPCAACPQFLEFS
jgi:hypothetical protein